MAELCRSFGQAQKRRTGEGSVQGAEEQVVFRRLRLAASARYRPRSHAVALGCGQLGVKGDDKKNTGAWLGFWMLVLVSLEKRWESAGYW